jgi:hypothetical protein
VTRDWWFLVVDSLATYRLAVLVTRDTITEPLRQAIRRHGWTDAETYPTEIGTLPGRFARWLFALMGCMYCTSLWLAAAVVALTRFYPSEWQYVGMVLALSAVAGFLGER